MTNALSVSQQTARAVLGEETGDGVGLRLERVWQSAETDWGVPGYAFLITLRGEPVGGIRLRIGDTDMLRLWGGHIGFNVDAAFRGQRIAEQATRHVLPLAAAHGVDPVWLTCDPDNAASRTVLERLGAVYVETLAVAPEYDLVEPGATQKRRYRLDLGCA